MDWGTSPSLTSLTSSSVPWVRLHPRLLSLRDAVRDLHQVNVEAMKTINDVEATLEATNTVTNVNFDVDQKLNQLQMLNKAKEDEESKAIEAYLAKKEEERSITQEAERVRDAEASNATATSELESAAPTSSTSSLSMTTTTTSTMTSSPTPTASLSHSSVTVASNTNHNDDDQNDDDEDDVNVKGIINRINKSQLNRMNGLKENEKKSEKESAREIKEEINSSERSMSESSLQSILNIKSINLSEFEGESDPFNSMELKTINELQELAAVLQTNDKSSSGFSANSNDIPTGNPSVRPRLSQQPSNNVVQPPFSTNISQNFGGSERPTGLPFTIPPQAIATQPTTQPFNNNGFAVNQGYGATAMSSQHPPNYVFAPWPQRTMPWTTTTMTNAATTSNTPVVKSSKSIGDLVAQVNEDPLTTPALNQHVKSNLKKPVSVTPPPNLINNDERMGTRKEESWIPWPTLETSSKSLDSKVVKQMTDMGFPRSRVLKAAEALGEEPSKIVHACLLIEKLCAEMLPETHVTHYVLSVGPENSEDRARKHLKAFVKLERLGFPSHKIHQALVHCDCDHDKALEELLN